MAAITAVFGVYELLENIIVHCPAWDIRGLRQVSQEWNQLIKGSKRIREARCLRVVDWVPDEYIPLYEPMPSSVIRMHRSLADPSSDETNSTPQAWAVELDTSINDYAMPFADDFATSPRRPMLAIRFRYPRSASPWWMFAMVYVRDGIKVRDILAVREGLVQTYREFVLGSPELDLRWGEEIDLRTRVLLVFPQMLPSIGF